jgi:DNA primase
MTNVALYSFVGRKVALDRRAGDRFVGLCPFDAEPKPSLNVHDRVGRFHCLSCAAQGDDVDFG